MSSLHGPIQFPTGLSTTNMDSSPVQLLTPLALTYLHKHRRTQFHNPDSLPKQSVAVSQSPL